MANTGAKYPAAAASTGWIDTDYIKVSGDGNYAWYILTSGYDSGLIYGYSFNAGVPAGAVINGLEVGIRRYCDGLPAVKDVQVQLYYDGGFKGDNKASADYWPNAAALKTYGGPTDKWGLSLTDTILNANGFTVGLVCHNHSGSSVFPYVDSVCIDVYYETWAHKACGIAMPSKVMGLGRSILKKFIGVG